MTVLKFNTDYTLENEIVKLRPLVPTDIEFLKTFSIHEPSLWDYSLTPANGIAHLESYFNAAFRDKDTGTSYPFIVFDKRKNAYAGSTRFYDYKPTHNTIQLGYTWYGSSFQGTGLNKNCKYLMLTFAFEKLGLDRVEFRADRLNIRSIAAMKSIGCVEEGILRNNCASVNGRRDSIILSILKDEWFTTVKDNLYKKCILESAK